MPRALRSAGYACQLHDNHFSQDTEDTVWLSKIASQQWIVLTKDEKIRHRPLEVQALISARLRTFIVISGNVRGIETAAILVKAMSRILKVLKHQRGPFIYHVYRDSSIKRMLTSETVPPTR